MYSDMTRVDVLEETAEALVLHAGSFVDAHARMILIVALRLWPQRFRDWKVSGCACYVSEGSPIVQHCRPSSDWREARRRSWRRWRIGSEGWRRCKTLSGPATRGRYDEDLRAKRSLETHTRDTGTTEIIAALDPESAEVVAGTLDARVQAEWR